MTSTRKAFQDLIDLLVEETQIYAELASLLEVERDALKRLRAPLLEEIAAKKDTLGLRLKALGESRLILARRMGRGFGIASDELTVTELTHFAPRDLRGTLDRARTELRDQVLACKKVNEYNSMTATQGIDLVRSAIGFLIADHDPAGKIYERKGTYGRVAKSARPVMISKQV